MSALIHLAGVDLLPLVSGALLWPAERTLVVADLHFEKGSSIAKRGRRLPPYDTAATLGRLGADIAAHDPRRIIALGDSFHDDDGAGRLGASDRETLARLAEGRQWIWVAGNHDPAPPADLPGMAVGEMALGPLMFRHQAEPGHAEGEISGHFHPVASLKARGKTLSGRCFGFDDRRLLLPAYGAYTGGLDILTPVVARHFRRPFQVQIIAGSGLYRFPSTRLRPPPARLSA